MSTKGKHWNWSKKSRKKLGKSISGKNHWNWKGGAKRKTHRYNHRWKMEQKLKRKLKSNEIIHHIDGNHKNNKLSNLKIETRSSHAKYHMKIIKLGNKMWKMRKHNCNGTCYKNNHKKL